MPKILNLSLKTEALPILMLIVSVCLGVYYYLSLPEQVATHWNIAGEIDGYSGKTFVAIFFPALNFVLYAAFLLLPILDPLKKNYAHFSQSYHIIKASLLVFLTLIYGFIGLVALGYPLPINVVVPALISLLFIILGLSLKQVKPNWFFGIRTPWTLQNETVWQKTHELGAKCFVVAGLLNLILSIFSLPYFWLIFLIITSLAAFVPVIYSAVIYPRK